MNNKPSTTTVKNNYRQEKTTFFACKKNFVGTQQTLVRPIGVFVFTAQKQELFLMLCKNYQIIGFRGLLLFFVLLLLWNNTVHQFCPISDTPKKGTKSGIFQNQIPAENSVLQKNSGLRATKTLIVWKQSSFRDTPICYYWPMFFMCLKNGHPLK